MAFGRNTALKAHFLVDTGAPATYLSEDILQALGVDTGKSKLGLCCFREPQRHPPLGVYFSLHQPLSDINLIGPDFLTTSEALCRI